MIAEALKHAEQTTDPERSITRAEARLVVEYAACYDIAVMFVKHVRKYTLPMRASRLGLITLTGWLDFAEKEVDHWPTTYPLRDEAQELFASLQASYGAAGLPSKETITIAATYLYCKLVEHQFDDEFAWLDEQYFDIFILLWHTRTWRTVGRPVDQDTLRDVCFDDGQAPIDLANVEIQAELEDWAKDLTIRNVITTKEQLVSLQELSPIAAAVFDSPSRNPQNMGKGHANFASAKALGTYARDWYQNKTYAQWVDHFWPDTAPPRLQSPRPLDMKIPQVQEIQDEVDRFTAKFGRFSHWKIVAQIWQGIIAPIIQTANDGEEENVEEALRQLEEQYEVIYHIVSKGTVDELRNGTKDISADFVEAKEEEDLIGEMLAEEADAGEEHDDEEDDNASDDDDESSGHDEDAEEEEDDQDGDGEY